RALGRRRRGAVAQRARAARRGAASGHPPALLVGRRRATPGVRAGRGAARLRKAVTTAPRRQRRHPRRLDRRSERTMSDQRIVGLVAASTPAFVTQVFASWRAGAAVVVLRAEVDHERLRLAGGSEVLVPGAG